MPLTGGIGELYIDEELIGEVSCRVGPEGDDTVVLTLPEGPDVVNPGDTVVFEQNGLRVALSIVRELQGGEPHQYVAEPISDAEWGLGAA